MYNSVKKKSGTTYCFMKSMYVFFDVWFPGFHTHLISCELCLPKQSKSWTPSERKAAVQYRNRKSKE